MLPLSQKKHKKEDMDYTYRIYQKSIDIYYCNRDFSGYLELLLLCIIVFFLFFLNQLKYTSKSRKIKTMTKQMDPRDF